MKPKILAALITIVTFTSGLVGQNSQSLPSQELEARQIKGMDFNHVSTVNALTKTLNAAHVPGGVATAIFCGTEDRHDLTPLGPTVRDALDSIVVANPQYRWFVDRGAVNLMPSAKELSLLDVVIADFKVESSDSQDDIVRRLLAVPEVKHSAKRLQLSRGFTEIGIRPLERPGSNASEVKKGFILHLQNVTLREALNAITRAHGSAVWSYQEKLCDESKEFSLSFLVW
jgi:hypothetical protein